MADDRRNVRKGTSARSRSQGRQSGDGTYKRGLNTKIHMAVDAAGKPVRFIVTSGTVADCSQAENLIKDTGAKYLLNEIIETAENAGMEVIIPPKRNRKVSREYAKNAYKLRHILVFSKWYGFRYGKVIDINKIKLTAGLY